MPLPTWFELSHFSPHARRSTLSASAKAVEERRQAILDAAEALFAENGIAATSVRSILAAAGANVAAVHYHFGSKEKLVEGVFRRRAEKIANDRVRGLKRALANPDTTWRLERIVRAFLVLPRGIAPEGGADAPSSPISSPESSLRALDSRWVF